MRVDPCLHERLCTYVWSNGADVGQNMMQEDGSGGCEREEQEGGGSLQDDEDGDEDGD